MNQPLLLLLSIILLLQSSTHASVLDNYCGSSWVNAANACLLHCPSGSDSECTAKLGEGFGCYLFTGCHARVEAGEFGDRDPIGGLDEEEEEDVMPAEEMRFCGVDYLEAMLTCDEGNRCRGGDTSECSGGDVCVENLNCDKPLVTLTSEIIFTFTGTTTLMEDEDWNIFDQVIFSTLKSTTTDLNIHLESITLQTQRSYDDTATVEVDVLLLAKYRPPPDKKLSTIAENSINLQKDAVHANLKKVGAENKRYYFTTEVKDIGAVSKENATKRPTLSPTGSPTYKPTDVPSLLPSPSPSGVPTTSPSGAPSSVPSRAHVQEIETATTNEIKNFDDTAHGFLVNMRTTSESPVVLINGLEFYTERTDAVGFELWSKLGTFEGYEGTYDGWDMIATGMVKGAGYGRYTSIPTEAFTPVSIPGGGGDKGTRAFYLTLNSKDLVINLGKTTTSTGATDKRVMASTPDLEIYNGKAVLSYPFPNPAETWFYHSPRVFLGVVTYDRLPCKPFSLYGPVEDLPCGDVPTVRPTLKPTMVVDEQEVVDVEVGDEDEVEEEEETTVTTAAPTLKPSSNPTAQLALPVLETLPPTTSFAPTTSILPTMSTSPSMAPTSSPVASQKARIIVTLHNTPARFMRQDELDIFIDTLIQFLNDQTGKTMVVGGIDVQSEDAIEVMASPTLAPVTTPSPQVATNVSSTINTTNTTSTSQEVARTTLRQRLLKQVPGVRLTVILSIISTTLPHNLLGNMAVVAVEENYGELVAALHKVGVDYSYFDAIDKVTSASADVDVWDETDKNTIESDGGASLVKSTDEESSVNIGLLVSLFWLTLAVGSIVLLTKARSKIINDNIEIQKSDQPEPTDHSDTNLRTSILMPIPLGTDINSDSSGLRKSLRRSLMSRSSRKSRRSGSESMESSLRDESFRNDSSLMDSDRSGFRSSMRRSLTMSQILGVNSDSDSDAELRNSGVRRSITMRASLRRSMSSTSVEGNDTSLRSSGVRRSGTNMRASLRRSSSSLKGSLKDNDTSLRSSSVRRSGTSMRASLRRSSSSLKDNDASLRSSSVRRSGTAMRASMRRSISESNHSTGMHDEDAKTGESLRKSRAQNNLVKSVVFDDNLPSLMGSERDEDEELRKSQINVDSEANTEEGEGESKIKIPERAPRRPRRLSQSMTAKDAMSWGLAEEKKEDQIVLKNDLYKSKSLRRSGNEASLRGSTTRRNADNLASSGNEMGRLRRPDSRGSSDNPRPVTKRTERRLLSQSMTAMSTTRQGNGDAASIRRSNGARGSSDNLRASARRGPVANGLKDSTTHRRSSDGDRQGSGDAASIRRSNGARGTSDNLRGSTRRGQVTNGLKDSTTDRRSSDGDNTDDRNLRGSNRAMASTNDTNLRGSVRRGNDNSNLRVSSRRTASANLRGSVRRNTNEALRGSVRRNTENLRGSVRRRDSEGSDSDFGGTRTNDQPRRAGPRRREIV